MTKVHGCTRHGHCTGGSTSPEYNAWAHLLDRCRNPKNRKYPSYGGRGITVCERWEASFENFLADMGPRPSPKHSIERRENDGPYAPWNCEWAPRSVQARNRRNNRHFKIEGQRLCMADAARLARIPLGTFRMRLEHGWTLERAFSTPVRSRRRSSIDPGRETRSSTFDGAGA